MARAAAKALTVVGRGRQSAVGGRRSAVSVDSDARQSAIDGGDQFPDWRLCAKLRVALDCFGRL